MLGRTFTRPEEDAHQPLAVISYRLWMNRFHRDPHVLGSSITLSRKAYTVIGVMPRSFDFPIQQGSLHPVQVWIPLSRRARKYVKMTVAAASASMAVRVAAIE